VLILRDNQPVARVALFEKEVDYAAFERVLEEAARKHPTRILGYCVMPNHWHIVLWPRWEGELTDFLCWLIDTHTMRWHAHFHTAARVRKSSLPELCRLMNDS
jgi:putative transposase